jgi:glutathione S-transferase
LGSNTIEAAQILAIAEHIKEMRTAYSGLVPWGAEPSPESDVWFSGGAEDLTGTADRAGQKTRYLNWWTGRIEATLDSRGFAVGSKLSLADVLLFNAYGEVLAADQAAPDFPAYRREPFGSKEKTDAVLAKFPKVAASVKAVASNANVKKWLAMRGTQGF